MGALHKSKATQRLVGSITLRVMRFLCIFGLWAITAFGAEVRIENYSGDIHVEISSGGPVDLQNSVSSRPIREDDIEITRESGLITIVCRPTDDAKIDLHLRVPMRIQVAAKTTTGKISMRGFPSLLTAQTVTGELDLEAPWKATRFLMFASEQPKKLSLPNGVGFRKEKDSELPGVNWIIQDKRGLEDVTYGRVRVRADKPTRVTLRDMPIPSDSPVKMAWQAVDVLDDVLAGRRPQPPAESVSLPAENSLLPSNRPAETADQAMFSSDVRMVNLTAAVYDAERRPLTGLNADDFKVVENAVTQDVAVVEPEETPFNLVILLDLSASTRRNRDEMKAIVRRFIDVARPQDRIALYGLANNWFLALSELSTDRESLLAVVEDIPPLSGGSPIYDSIALAYGQELAALPNERNAMIVITDGLDNQFASTGLASKVGHEDLVNAAQRVDALIYPVFLGKPPEEQRSRSNEARAYERLDKIAAASGGKVFVADPEGDYFEQVAEELRAVYSVAYYPKNQDFEGELRSVDVQVNRPGAIVRSRDGYFAR